MKNLILTLLIIFPGYCFSQFDVSVHTGVAGFNMKAMKKHQSELKADLPVNVKVIESFPAFWFYEVSLTGKINDEIKIGGVVEFTSTGGRMNYRDYSGGIECNQLTTAWVTAIRGELLLNPDDKLPISLACNTGVAFGRYGLNLSIELNDAKDSEHLKLYSTNFFIQPGIMAYKQIFGTLGATFNAGYNINVVKGNLKLADNNQLHLIDNSGNEVTLDWSGFRVGIGLSVVF